MADLEAIERDLTEVLKHIPAEVVGIVHNLAENVLNKYREELPKIAALAFFKLQPHAKALGVELASGITDLKELEPVLSNALKSVVDSHAETRKAG